MIATVAALVPIVHTVVHSVSSTAAILEIIQQVLSFIGLS